jgi:hypothetical protein
MLTEEIMDWLDKEIIEVAPVDTTFNAPIFSVPKKDGDGKLWCRSKEKSLGNNFRDEKS